MSVVSILVFYVSLVSHSSAMRTAGCWVLLSVLTQVLVGLLVWGTKYGFAPTGIVAVQHSPLQIAMRSLHTITGMCVVATAVFWSVEVLRTWRTSAARSDCVG